MTVCTAVVNASETFGSNASRGEVYLPRVILRKRKAAAEGESACLPSVNSALLDGLFADVAEIHQSCDETPPSATTTEEVASSLSIEIPTSPASKKSRASLTHSISRSPKSFKWLGDAFFPSVYDLPSQATAQSSSGDLTHQISPGSSAATQNIYVSQSEELVGCPNIPSFSNRCESPSFHLPTTVSSSSCNPTLTRVISDLQSSTTENEEKDSYGWFVEMDAEAENETVNPYQKSSSTQDLAFVAPTAPNAVDQDAEVEWAKAADTVDSVLGDFF